MQGSERDDNPWWEYGGRPPEQGRAWRHPSELGSPRTAASPSPGPRPENAEQKRTWGVAALSAVAGAALSVAIIAATGGLSQRVIETTSTELIATPGVSPLPNGPGFGLTTGEWPTGQVAELTTATGPHPAVAIRDSGHLVTAAADLAGMRAGDEFELTLADELHEATVDAIDSRTGLAIVSIDAELRPPVLGTSSSLTVHQPVGIIGTSGQSVRAQVSGLRRSTGPATDATTSQANGDLNLHGLIELRPGPGSDFVGAGVHDELGALVGVVVEGGSAVEPAYAVPVTTATRLAHDISRYGKIRQVWLGLEGVSLPGEIAETMGIAGAATVHSVTDDGPADQAGLAEGDIVVTIEGTAIRSIAELIVAVREQRPGSVVDIGYVRDDQLFVTTAVLTEPPLGLG